MVFALPAVKDNCNISRGAGDPKWLANINSPSNTGTKSAGSLPITGVATEFDNNTNASVKGYAKEFENGQTPVYDVSADTKVMLWHSQFNAPNRIQTDTLANGGTRLRIYSGTGTPPTTYKEFYLGGRDTPWAECIKGHYPMTIDLNDTSHNVSVGVFDNTNVTSFAYLTARLNMAGGSTNWNYQGKLYVLDTSKASSNTPTFTGTSEFQDAVDLIQGFDYTDKLGNWVRKIGSVIFIDMGFRIGDNSTSTQFDDSGITIISPPSNDSTDPRVRVTTQAFRTYINLRNNVVDTATFSGTWVWGTRAAFDWAQNDAAVVTFDSPIFNGMGSFTLGSSITGPATWDNVDIVIMDNTGVDIDGSVFKNIFGAHALELGGAMDIANMRFESYAGLRAILIDTAGTYNFDNIFFDQSGAFDIETTHASGTVTINLSNGSTVPTVQETGAGAVVINNFVTLSVTTQDSNTVAIPYSKIRIENASNGALISGGYSNNLGVYTDSSYNYTIDVGINVIARKNSPGSFRYRAVSQPGTIIGTGISITAQMLEDTVAGTMPVSGILRTGVVSEDEVGNAIVTADIDLPSGVNRKLLIGAIYWDSSSDLTYSIVDYDGNAMTSIAGASIHVEESGGTIHHEMASYYYDILDSDTGRKTISVTLSGNVALKSIIFTILEDVVSGAPNDTGSQSGSAVTSNPSISVNNTFADAWSVMFLITDDIDSPSATGVASIYRSDLMVNSDNMLAVLATERATTGAHSLGADYGANSKTWVSGAITVLKN